MRHTKPYTFFWLLLSCLLLAGARCTIGSDNNSNTTTTTTRVESEQKLSATAGGFNGDLAAGDEFGSAVANLGDLEGDGVTDLAVGAPSDDGNGMDRGAVWVLFLDSDGRVDLKQRIGDGAGGFDGNLVDGGRFGDALAAIGDLNADGVADLAVGAPQDDDGGTDRGAVWILFLDAEGKVLDFQKISNTAGGFDGILNDGDQFGGAVTAIGDLDGDGVGDLAVGAKYANDGGTGKGAVWILFMDTDGTVKSQQKIADGAGNFNGDLNNDDHFGSAVASIGDLDGDDVNDLAVGADQSDGDGSDRGAVWILFLDKDGTVLNEEKITQGQGGFEGNLADGDRFGSAVADIGDQDGDGVTDLAVGADQSDDGGPDRGAVWILYLDENSEVRSDSKISSAKGNFEGNLDDDDRFGSAVTGIDDLDGNGVPDIAVGAPLDDDGGTDMGALWILFMKQTD